MLLGMQYRNMIFNRTDVEPDSCLSFKSGESGIQAQEKRPLKLPEATTKIRLGCTSTQFIRQRCIWGGGCSTFYFDFDYHFVVAVGFLGMLKMSRSRPLKRCLMIQNMGMIQTTRSENAYN